ncbi:esterase/lipase family protein [Nocardioides donggukensis]|uniref:Alpha/beta hydrolase n=1 Tax=Nocardioides donggukensis TaxID=2774019 RepID=A0A927PZK9_9ACTN|nr:alpha/beta fold hydrolase [Nocardioides donggukensis]MBD8870373.1 alpha/beta hydrolase [Nocardioides donggukensis]
MGNHLAPFLAPEGYAQPRFRSLVQELRLAPEVGRASWRAVAVRRELRATPYVRRSPARAGEPVLLVPGFLAGDYSLRLMAATLRRHGYRTYRSQIRTNVSCMRGNTALLERRLEAIAARRGSRVRIVGHSLGGMLARGLAVRRPDLVSGIVTMGSPMLAPGTAHPVLLSATDVLVRLTRAGVPGLMSEDCVGGVCAREAWEESRSPLPPDVDFSAIYSRWDGLVDWRSCIDPAARAVEVRASHVGMAVDPRVADAVVAELGIQRSAAARRARRSA